MRAIGLMSGTSMDGIDIALIDTDGASRIEFGPTASAAYQPEQRAALRQALVDARDLEHRDDRPGVLASVERMITALHADAVERFLVDRALEPAGIDVVGFHGQTVVHRPDRGLTVQLGDGADLARRLGINVVADLRGADVAQGGQGAPLVPAFHRALVMATGLPLPALVVNIGGVSNITVVTAGADPLACDTGPGNALLDDLMLARSGVAYDRDGATGSAGRVEPETLARLLDHPFFALPPPKSLDRNAFSGDAVKHLSTADAAATLAAFTAAAIATSLKHVPASPEIAIVCGGGAHNAAIMRELESRMPCRVTTGEAVGWAGDSVEAQALAYLAVRSRLALPLTFPTTTGVPAPAMGGVFFAP